MKIFAGALFTNKKKIKQDRIRIIPNWFFYKYLKNQNKSEQIRTNSEPTRTNQKQSERIRMNQNKTERIRKKKRSQRIRKNQKE